jgi:DNA-binding NarL/FixJ family response regulator
MDQDSVPIRVFLCDDVREFRVLLRYGLQEDPEIEIVGEAGDGRAGVDAVAELRPDVVLLDLSMPVLDGLEAIPLIRERSPGTCIVVLSGFARDRMRDAVMEAGAHDYVEKGVPLRAIAEAIRACRARAEGERTRSCGSG